MTFKERQIALRKTRMKITRFRYRTLRKFIEQNPRGYAEVTL